MIFISCGAALKIDQRRLYAIEIVCETHETRIVRGGEMDSAEKMVEAAESCLLSLSRRMKSPTYARVRVCFAMKENIHYTEYLQFLHKGASSATVNIIESLRYNSMFDTSLGMV